ncbi:MAG: NADH-quinone oxidoreductase subunit NuoK [Coriobacteriia bacterium]|nr:NADH-quinone oxidoreductase subunit NuoK [Coriobacteriia bacterium]
MITGAHYVVLASTLFCIGLFGAMTARSALRIVVCIELMINAAILSIIAFAATNAAQPVSGLSFVLLIAVVSAAEVGLALALIVSLSRSSNITAVDSYSYLKG